MLSLSTVLGNAWFVNSGRERGVPERVLQSGRTHLSRHRLHCSRWRARRRCLGQCFGLSAARSRQRPLRTQQFRWADLALGRLPGLPDQCRRHRVRCGGQCLGQPAFFTPSPSSRVPRGDLPAATAEPTRNGYSGADYSTTSPCGRRRQLTCGPRSTTTQEYGVATVTSPVCSPASSAGACTRVVTSSLAMITPGTYGRQIFSAGGLSEFSNSGAALSPSTGYTGGGLVGVDGLAIDGAGNIWLSTWIITAATRREARRPSSPTPARRFSPFDRLHRRRWVQSGQCRGRRLRRRMDASDIITEVWLSSSVQPLQW